MNLNERLTAFNQLGHWIADVGTEEMDFIYQSAKAHNGWFTKENIDHAFNGIKKWLSTENLLKWVHNYQIPEVNQSPIIVGVVMAGNIPLVGFHDFLSILITGNKVQAKVSSQDPFLIKHLVEKLIFIEPRFRQNIEFVERLNHMDAVIATGSDNTSRYFDYYFGKYPHIIRKNRISLALLNGQEAKEDFENLGQDIFQYYGLGCRNISKLFVPINYDFNPLIKGFTEFEHLMNNHKYANNYHYNRSIFLVNQTPHWDAEFFLLQKNEGLASPTSVIYFEEYSSIEELEEKLTLIKDKIQCVVSKDQWFSGSLSFGKAQEPELWDYADNVDTIDFLLGHQKTR